MAAWRLSAVTAVFVVAAFVGGATVRVFEAVGDRPALISLAVLALVVLVAVVLGTRARRLRTPYW